MERIWYFQRHIKLLCLCLDLVLWTCPCATKVYGVEVLSEGQVESMWSNEGKVPFLHSRASQILLITKETVVYETH